MGLLEIKNLSLQYHTPKGSITAVNNVSFALEAGASLGLVGESGSGKSSVANAILQLLPSYAQIDQGEVLFAGRDLLRLAEPQLREVRWQQIAMVFQAAMNTLNPMYTVGEQVIETIQAHEPHITVKAAQARVQQLFARLGLPLSLIQRYPHEYSGGMKQRAGIALALACEPQLLIADEPTTALDVVMQARIMSQLEAIRQEHHMSVIYITHDIAMIAQVSDHMGVMYAGCLVEYGKTTDLLAQPGHPYTAGLLVAVPSLAGDMSQVQEIPGEPVDLNAPPLGCCFHPRCTRATSQCKTQIPSLTASMGDTARDHMVACWHPLFPPA